MCIPAVGYHIAIKTGSINGASSDSKVFVKLYGEKGDTNKMLLVVSDNDLGNYFETGQTDIFTIETFDIGRVCHMSYCHQNYYIQAFIICHIYSKHYLCIYCDSLLLCGRGL